jgi:hypothetical protein
MKWNVLLAALLSVSLAAFLALAVLVWLNRGGDRVSLLFLKAVFGPLAVTLFLVGYDLARPLEKSEATVPLTFFHGRDEPIGNDRLASDDTLNPEPSAYMWMIFAYHQWLEKHRAEPAEANVDLYLNIAQAGFFDWLVQRYPGHWQVEEEILRGAFAGGGRLGKRVPGAELNPVTLAAADLAKITGNELLNSSAFGSDLKLGLPSNCRVSQAIGDHGERNFMFSTPHIDFQVSFWAFPPELGFIPKKGPSKKIAEALGTEEIKVTYVYVKFVASPKRFTRWSGRTATELTWAQDVSRKFEQDFKWTITPP